MLAFSASLSMPPFGRLAARGATWPLHFLFTHRLVLGPVTRALVKCPAGNSEWVFDYVGFEASGNSGE